MNSTDELNFAYKVRHALNEQAERLPSATTDRLAAARLAALARKKADDPVAAPQQQAALAGLAGWFGGWSGAGSRDSGRLLGRLSLAVPALALVAGLVNIYKVEQEQHIAELAEVDAAVLADELPLSAYLDHGFNAYLSQRESDSPKREQ